jgi:hypothetical protein
MIAYVVISPSITDWLTAIGTIGSSNCYSFSGGIQTGLPSTISR